MKTASTFRPLESEHPVADAVIGGLSGTPEDKLQQLQKFTREAEIIANQSWAIIFREQERANDLRRNLVEAKRLLDLCSQHYGEDSDVFYQVRDFLASTPEQKPVTKISFGLNFKNRWKILKAALSSAPSVTFVYSNE